MRHSTWVPDRPREPHPEPVRGLVQDTPGRVVEAVGTHHVPFRIKAITGRIDLVHCNNSRDETGSGRDRHANIASGTIDPALLLGVVQAAGATAICETPEENGGLAADVSWLKQRVLSRTG